MLGSACAPRPAPVNYRSCRWFFLLCVFLLTEESTSLLVAEESCFLLLCSYIALPYFLNYLLSFSQTVAIAAPLLCLLLYFLCFLPVRNLKEKRCCTHRLPPPKTKNTLKPFSWAQNCAPFTPPGERAHEAANGRAESQRGKIIVTRVFEKALSPSTLVWVPGALFVL